MSSAVCRPSLCRVIELRSAHLSGHCTRCHIIRDMRGDVRLCLKLVFLACKVFQDEIQQSSNHCVFAQSLATGLRRQTGGRNQTPDDEGFVKIEFLILRRQQRQQEVLQPPSMANVFTSEPNNSTPKIRQELLSCAHGRCCLTAERHYSR